MGTSPLAGGGAETPKRVPGTGTDALGPSDTSDSGSDIHGADGAVETDDFDLSGGTNEDVRRAPGAGADIGDANLDSDSDSAGTGERAEAGRDTLQRDAPDIAPDRIEGTDEPATDVDALGVEEVDPEDELEGDLDEPEGDVEAGNESTGRRARGP
jgi:hypothetical protein